MLEKRMGEVELEVLTIEKRLNEFNTSTQMRLDSFEKKIKEGSGTHKQGSDSRSVNITANKGFNDVPVFNGELDSYDSWARKVKTYLCSEGPKFRRALRVAEDEKGPFTEATFQHVCSEAGVSEEIAEWMSQQVYSLMPLKCKGAP